MTLDKDLLLLKDYVIRVYQQDLDFIISTAVEAELRGLLTNSLDKYEFYRGQQSCLERILNEYRSISEDALQNLFEFISEKRELWERYPKYIVDQSVSFQKGYQQRLELCASLLTGLQGFLEDNEFGGTIEEYIVVLEEADQFADKQLLRLLSDVGLTVEELQQYQVPFWKEYISVYRFNMRELYFSCPDIECKPMPIFQRKIKQLKSSNDETTLCNLLEEKFQHVTEEMCMLVNRLNRE